MSTYQLKYTFCMHTRTTRRRFRLQKQTLVFGGHVGGHIGFLSSPSFMPAVSETTENGEHFGI